MREQLETRLVALRGEYESGQKLLIELDARRARLTETMLRISGAIQVLQEELSDSQPASEQVLTMERRAV